MAALVNYRLENQVATITLDDGKRKALSLAAHTNQPTAHASHTTSTSTATRTYHDVDSRKLM